MKFNKLSIKNFIGDLPRIFNENFETLKGILDSVIDNKNDEGELHKLSASEVKATGTIKAGTVEASNILLTREGKTESLAEIIRRLENLEATIKKES